MINLSQLKFIANKSTYSRQTRSAPTSSNRTWKNSLVIELNHSRMRLAKDFFLLFLPRNGLIIAAVRRPPVRDPGVRGATWASTTHYKHLSLPLSLPQCHTTTLPHCHIATLPYYHTTTLSLCHSVTLRLCPSATLLHYHTITLLHYHTVITVALPYCYIIIHFDLRIFSL